MVGGRRGRTDLTCLLAVAAALAGAGRAAGDHAAAARRIPARIVEGGLLVLPVQVNGTGPYPFLLDTGATSSIVDETLARDLGLPGAGVAHQVSPNGRRAVPLARASLRLGAVGWTGAVLASPLGGVKEVDPLIRGVLGQDLMRQANWWIDQRQGFVFEDVQGALASADLGERLPVHWQADRPAIEALLPGRRAVRLVLDSAATSPFVSGHVGGPGARLGRAVLSTHEGDTTIDVVALGPLRVGRATLPPLAAGLLEVRPGGEDGLLPTALFDRLYFDNRAGTVVLNPRSSALPADR